MPAGGDVRELLRECLEDTENYYEISFEAPAGSGADEYHRVEIRVGKPGLKARARGSYYAQVSTAGNDGSGRSADQTDSAKN